MALSDADVTSSLSEPDPSTKGFIFQQTMFRIKDPKASLDFYTRVMGMRFVELFQFKDGAYQYRSIFVRFMTMREKQILGRPIGIQNKNWG